MCGKWTEEEMGNFRMRKYSMLTDLLFFKCGLEFVKFDDVHVNIMLKRMFVDSIENCTSKLVSLPDEELSLGFIKMMERKVEYLGISIAYLIKLSDVVQNL